MPLFNDRGSDKRITKSQFDIALSINTIRHIYVTECLRYLNKMKNANKMSIKDYFMIKKKIAKIMSHSI